MRKIIMAVATALLFFCLSACGSDDSATPAPTATVTQSAVQSPDELFANQIRSAAPYVALSPTEDIIDLTRGVCAAFDDGFTFEQVALRLISSGAPGRDAGTIIGGAIGYFCPEHQDVLNDSSTA